MRQGDSCFLRWGFAYVAALSMAGALVSGCGKSKSSASPDSATEQSKASPAAASVSDKPAEGLKLSQHDLEIGSPSIVVGPAGTIHVAFMEKHRKTFAPAIYYRSSADGGKSWTDAKNLSEDMPGINVGRTQVRVDASNRVYVVWRAGLAPNFSASVDPYGGGSNNLWFRVLEGGKWSKIEPVHPPGSRETQNDGSISYFVANDPAGKVHVVWNTTPDKWHPELVRISGNFHQHLPGIGNGLVFQSTLNGATATPPKEIFLTPVSDMDKMSTNPYAAYCDGLETLNGYFDSSGAAHFIAAVTRTHDGSLRGKSFYEVVDAGKIGATLDLPELSYHGWRDIPTLLLDAKGKQHAIVLYPAGERPNVRDYLLGSQDESTVIRAAAAVNGTADGFQAYQGPGGRMVAVMQMNDTGQRGDAENYVSVSNGDGKWSAPVNITNNAARKRFASRQTSSQSNVAVETTYDPGPAAVAFDRDGHMLIVMITYERGLFASTAFGVNLAAGDSSTPTLRFIKL